MPRPLYDSPYIFGFHDPGGETIMANAGRRGWIVFTEALGTDPNDFSGRDYTPWSSQDFGIIVRLNNGYGDVGTIPSSDQYANFAKRVANFVAASQGCKIWVIGNEMNFYVEWPLRPGIMRTSQPGAAQAPIWGPQADPFGHGNPDRFSAIAHPQSDSSHPQSDPVKGAATPHPLRTADPSVREMITPTLYASCFGQCRNAIKLLAGHGDDQVVVGAVAPWNDNAKYPGNEIGDWVTYLSNILSALGSGGLDGIALHTYTHGPDPALVTSTATMNAPFQNRYYEFLAYRNFMEGIPPAMRGLPVYITETDQNDPWLDANNGWVQAAYAEINSWNQQHTNQQIRALALYRWPPVDQWYIQGKQGVIDGMTDALRFDYRWNAPLPKPANFQAGDTVRTTDFVNFRQAPAGQTIVQLAPDTRLTVISGEFVPRNGLIWWNLRRTDGVDPAEGWVAQFTTDGIILLEEVVTAAVDTLKPGDKVTTKTIVRMRKSPGSTNKPADDIVAEVPAGATFTVFGGPAQADGMTWWRNAGVLPDGKSVQGWMAEVLPDGTVLLEKSGATVKPPGQVKPEPTFQPGSRYQTATLVNLRRTAGSANKPNDDIVAQIATGTPGVVLSGPVDQDGLTWWKVTTTTRSGAAVDGYMAEALADGTVLMEKLAPVTATFAGGDLGVTTDYTNVRRSPGTSNKPADDILAMLAPGAVVNILGGPVQADGLTWWQVAGIAPSGGAVQGYAAETIPGGGALLIPPPKLPGTNIPDKASNSYLAAPFQQRAAITQLWGENPDFYRQFSYDGVALLGHNGIDLGMQDGTVLLAVDGGTVARTGFEDNGFGNYILLSHSWGESIYGHLQSIGVQPGQAVGQGQFIGLSDNTGGSTGPHLHFVIRINPYSRSDGWGGFSNPLPYLPPASYVLPDYLLPTAPVAASGLAAPGKSSARQAPSSMGDIPGSERP